jgi:hypothetical protein
MRNVEYITNGFGAPPLSAPDPYASIRVAGLLPVPDPYSGAVYTKEQLSLRGGTDFPRAFPPAPPSDYAVLQAFNDQNIPGPIASAGLQTYKSRGIAGIDQAVNFIRAMGEGFNAYERSGLWVVMRDRMGYEKAILDAFNRVFNTAASRFGANPLTNAFRDAIIKLIRQDASNAKLILYSVSFIYSALVDVRKRLAR